MLEVRFHTVMNGENRFVLIFSVSSEDKRLSYASYSSSSMLLVLINRIYETCTSRPGKPRKKIWLV